MVTENIGVSFEDKKSLDIQVNIGGNEAFQVPVYVNSLDAEKVGQQIGEIITGDFDETLLANVAKEETLLEVKTAIENIGGSSGDIDLTGVAKENTLLTESAAIQSKLDNIQLPEIDTTELAKQGENKNATNSKILEEVGNIKETFDSIGIPISAISGLALELEEGKKNIANALKARGIESSVNTDTLTDMAAKVYEVKNPVAFTVPAETSNELANDFFNIMFKSQGYDQIYESVYETYCGEGGSYVGCLMTDLNKGTNTAIQLIGADAYYIYEEDIFYKTGEGGKLIQFLNGSETQLTTDKHMWDTELTNPHCIVFYLYLPNSTANGQRENVHTSNIDYCRNSSIPYIQYKSNGGMFMYFHLSNPESCVLSYSGTASNTRTIFFYSNVETCSTGMELKGNQDYMCFFNLESLKSVIGGIVVNSLKLRHIDFPNLEEIADGTLLSNYKSVKSFSLPKLRTVSKGCILTGVEGNFKVNNIMRIELPQAEELIGKGKGTVLSGVINIKAKELELIIKSGCSVRYLVGCCGSNSNIMQSVNLTINCEELYNPNNITNSTVSSSDLYAENIYFKGLKKCKLFLGSTASYISRTKYININCIGERTDKIELIHSSNQYASTLCTDIEINQGARQPLTFNIFKGLTAENIVNHIFERLADNRFEDDGITPAPAITITICSTNLNKLTDAQKAIATDKNYILA